MIQIFAIGMLIGSLTIGLLGEHQTKPGSLERINCTLAAIYLVLVSIALLLIDAA